MQSLWSTVAMRQQITEQIAFMDAAADTHHRHGGKIIPFSVHNVDEVLGDLGVNVSPAVRALHWLGPVGRRPTAASPRPCSSGCRPPRRRCPWRRPHQKRYLPGHRGSWAHASKDRNRSHSRVARAPRWCSEARAAR